MEIQGHNNFLALRHLEEVDQRIPCMRMRPVPNAVNKQSVLGGRIFMIEKKLNIMVIGAHPDDCDGGCGGIVLKYRKLGHAVQFVSTTNGSAGHQSYDRPTLAKIRKM